MASTNNFGFKRRAGILLSVSSLPSPYGIGSLGREAYAFVDFLHQTGQTVWQVLPLNPTSYGDSPYQSPASMVGNPYFIDPEQLCRDGLLTKEELDSARRTGTRVDYGDLFTSRYALLRTAYSRFTPDAAYRRFVKQNADWLEDYALFMALKVRYDFRPWIEWSATHRDVKAARADISRHEEEMGFWRFIQYTFMTEWRALTDYAHSLGIRILGDVPIYVAHDSLDVWRDPDQFLLDDTGAPIIVAGCPPDGFSPDGQLWGNPIYNWERMRHSDFSWWLRRFGYAFSMYDMVRIDHFRGFASFYAIPYGDENARRGHWMPAPGSALFAAVKEAYPRAKIIAEDLGFITEDVRELLAETGFPGMKILQFAFYEEDNEYLPRTYTTDNCVVYTGSHDADCTRTFIEETEGDVRRRMLRECPHTKGQSRTADLIDLALGSRANLAIIPMQDHLALKNVEGRMNTPSTAEGNWQWRMPATYDTPALRRRILSATEKAGRQNRTKQ